MANTQSAESPTERIHVPVSKTTHKQVVEFAKADHDRPMGTWARIQLELAIRLINAGADLEALAVEWEAKGKRKP